MPDLSTTRRAVLAGGVAALTTVSGSSGSARSAVVRSGASAGRRRFDRERFVAECVAAHRAEGMAAVREVLASAVADHRAVLAGLGYPVQAGLDVMHSSPTFTIFA